MIAVAASFRANSLLRAVEAEFFALRTQPADLHSALAAALAHAAGPDIRARFLAIGARVVDAVNAAAPAPELPYHNRHHIAEAVLASGWLLGGARRGGRITAADAALGVVAMVGHDLLHDGSAPCRGILERRSARAVATVTSGLDLSVREGDVLHAVIIGTDPARVSANAARAGGELPPGPLGRSVDAVTAMANEADVLASLMPDLGTGLTDDLIRERRGAGDIHAAELASYTSRLGFLATYNRLSPAARGLGLDRLLACQRQAFLRFGATTQDGAASLDRMPPDEARRRYSAALAVG